MPSDARAGLPRDLRRGKGEVRARQLRKVLSSLSTVSRRARLVLVLRCEIDDGELVRGASVEARQCDAVRMPGIVAEADPVERI